ncbi:major tail protein [Vibrio phage Seahorse]|uniref:Ig domain-containing protein n=1 Tax=Vibrio phage Seahorse TaxID=2662136 RepID=A0A6B7SET0_9CAUD|nr:major tail protein [Vibrio phage Seahorse]QGF21005.1 Ig domain-containing protein [Vibrio phage Seahorse]
MACQSKKFVGKERVVEYAITCGDSVPESSEWVRWAALRNSEINVTWDTTDATDADSVGSLRENLATFQSFSVSGDGTARRADHKDIWKHYCKPDSTGGQPVLWIRVTDPDLTFTAFCLLTTMSKPATYDDLVTFSFEASATASDFGLMVEDTPTPDAPAPASVDAYPETLTMTTGDTSQVIAIVSPVGASQSVIYETDDALVATVTQNGVVTAVGAGTAAITVKSSVDTLITDTVAVTVT